MDDKAKEAIRQLEELKTKFAAAPFDRSESESLLKQLRRSITQIFGEDHLYLTEISRRKFYYPKANAENKTRYFEQERKLFLLHIEQMINDLRLNGVPTKTLSVSLPIESGEQQKGVSVSATLPEQDEVEPDLVFLAMPFSEPWSNDVWETIQQIVGEADMRCLRGDESTGSDVMDDIWESIRKARVIIADLTAKNPNVAYEVGLADAIGKDVILLTQTPRDVPFDFLRKRLIPYTDSISGSNKLKAELLKRLKKYTT